MLTARYLNTAPLHGCQVSAEFNTLVLFDISRIDPLFKLGSAGLPIL